MALKTAQLEQAKRARTLDAQDRANQRPVGSNQYGEGLYDKSGDVQAPTGNTSAAALRRLRKSRPAILARVLAGEITPNKGMVEAGFRRAVVRKRLTALSGSSGPLPS